MISFTTNNLRLSSIGQGVCHLDISGNLSSSSIVNSDISPSAAIDNSKLAGNPVSTNTANTIVLRDVNGNFTTNAITASQISGNQNLLLNSLSGYVELLAENNQININNSGTIMNYQNTNILFKLKVKQIIILYIIILL